MSNFGGFSATPPAMSVSTQIDCIWAMGLASLVSNKFHIVVPMTVAEAIGDEGIDALKFRLSQYLTAPTVAYPDVVSHTMRICRFSDYAAGNSTSSSPEDQNVHVASPSSTSSTVNSPPKVIDISPERKSKVPRPPNAFILYRKHFHPILKEQHPTLHNNDISVILGKQWNAESEDVKSEYRTRAEKIKKKHAIDNPGYQYAPRKPSEKKRRMTSRKLAELRANEDQSSPLSHGSPSTSATSVAATPEFDFCAGTQNFFNTINDNEMALNLPAPIVPFEQQVWQHQDTPLPSPLVFDDELQNTTVSTATTAQNSTQQAFLNSIIDWDGIREDTELVFGATDEEGQALRDVEVGNFDVNFFPGFNDPEFEAELDRLSKMI